MTVQQETELLARPVLIEHDEDILIRFARNDWDTEPSEYDIFEFRNTDASLTSGQSIKENIIDYAQVYTLYLVRIFTRREVEAGRLSWADAMQCMGESCLVQYTVALERYQDSQGTREEVLYYMSLMAGYDCLEKEAHPSELTDNLWSNLQPKVLGSEPRKLNPRGV